MAAVQALVMPLYNYRQLMISMTTYNMFEY